MLLEFCDAKHLCIANSLIRKAEDKKITYGSGCNKSLRDFCIMGEVDRNSLRNVEVITGKLQHNLVIVDMDKKSKMETDWKPGSQKRNIAKSRDEAYRQLFECRVIEIMPDNHDDLWGSAKGVPKDCDEVCRYKKDRKCNVNTWWWNIGAKDEMQNKLRKNPTEETQNEYRRLKKAAEKAFARDMKDEAVIKINEFSRTPSNVFRLVRKMKVESTVAVGGRCMRGNVGTQKSLESTYVRNSE